MVQNKLFIAKHWNIQPSYIDSIVYFEYEYFLEEITKQNKEEEERQKKEQEDYDSSKYNPANFKMPDMSSFGSSFQMPSMPSF